MSKNKIIIIAISAGVVLIVILFFIFAKDKSTIPVPSGSISGGTTGIVSSNSNSSGANSVRDNEDADELLRILRSLDKIVLDRSLLLSTAYKNLVDFTVELPAPIMGRNNPFAPNSPTENYISRLRGSDVAPTPPNNEFEIFEDNNASGTQATSTGNVIPKPPATSTNTNRRP